MPNASPAGAWRARVVRPSATVDVRLHLAPTGAVFVCGGATAAGRWRWYRGRLACRLWEAIVDEGGGGYRGYVDIRQSGVVIGDTLRTKGDSLVYDRAGALLRTVAIHIEGHKESDDYRDITAHHA